MRFCKVFYVRELFFVLLSLLFSSCGFWSEMYNVFLDEGDYTYYYHNEKKEVDFSKGEWMIIGEDQELYDFFSKYLGERLKSLKNVKNLEGKYAYPYGLNDELITDEKLKEIYNSTNLDFLILINKEDRALRGNKYTDSNTLDITVFDLKRREIFYQIIGKVNVDANGNKVLKPHLRKRVLKKIKKQAV